MGRPLGCCMCWGHLQHTKQQPPTQRGRHVCDERSSSEICVCMSAAGVPCHSWPMCSAWDPAALPPKTTHTCVVDEHGLHPLLQGHVNQPALHKVCGLPHRQQHGDAPCAHREPTA